VSAQARIVFPVLAIAAALAGFWFMVISPKRAETAKVKTQISQAQARRDAAVGAAASAEQARRAYQRNYATLARLGKAVPADDDVASLVYQVESLSRAHKIDFRSVKLTGNSTATTPAPPAADSAKAGADTSGADKSAATTPAAPVVAQAPPGAVVGSAGLLTLPFTFTFDGGYMATQRMLGAIDRLADSTRGHISVNGRLLSVDGFSLAAGRHGFPGVQAQVSATAYIAPATDSITTAANPTNPTNPSSTAKPGGVPAGTASPGSTTATATIQGVRP
jgi:hypothetical protein